MTRARALFVSVLIAAGLSGCGGGSSSPSGPSPAPSTPTPPAVTDISGAWRGTWTSKHQGFSVVETATLSLTQSAAAAVGTVSSSDSSAAAAATLTVAGTEISGSVRFNYATGCQTTAQVKGSVSGGRLRFATSTVPASGAGWPCDWAQVQEFDLGR